MDAANQITTIQMLLLWVLLSSLFLWMLTFAALALRPSQAEEVANGRDELAHAPHAPPPAFPQAALHAMPTPPYASSPGMVDNRSTASLAAVLVLED